MKRRRFSQFKLMKELEVILFTFGAVILLYSALPDYDRTTLIQAQV